MSKRETELLNKFTEMIERNTSKQMKDFLILYECFHDSSLLLQDKKRKSKKNLHTKEKPNQEVGRGKETTR